MDSVVRPEARLSVIACPQCDAGVTFCRSPTPQIDICGFECYRLECEGCEATLGGVIDPSDETLLLSQLSAPWHCSSGSEVVNVGTPPLNKPAARGPDGPMPEASS